MSLKSYRARIFTGDIADLEQQKLLISQDTTMDEKLKEKELKVRDDKIAELKEKLNQ